jgi:hypothetical protein
MDNAKITYEVKDSMILARMQLNLRIMLQTVNGFFVQDRSNRAIDAVCGTHALQC